MTSALDSHFGLAKQTAKGTENTTDNDFKYFFFSEGTGISPQPVNLPLEQEIGSGSLTREVEKVGISSGGAINFVPRPDTLGRILQGCLGKCVTVTGADYHTHTFKFDTNEFVTPYYTFRRRVGALGIGERFPDVRMAGLTLNFNAQDYLRAQLGLIGVSAPVAVTSTTAWSAATKLDTTPPFITTTGDIELPAGSALKALSGSLTMGVNMPLDEQWIIGSLTPDDAEIVNRAIMLNLVVKGNEDLYRKMMYDPAGGLSWVAGVFKEADITLTFKSTRMIGASAQPYELQVNFNGEAAAGSPNVAWTVQSIALRGNRQVLMSVTGIVLADPASYVDGPFSVTLINDVASY